MAPRLVLVIVLAAGSLPSCAFAPDWTASGVWSVDFVRSGGIYLHIHQGGNTFSGTACQVGGGMVVYSAAIHGEFPDFHVNVDADDVGACCSHFIGARLEGTDRYAPRSSRQDVGVLLLKFLCSFEPSCGKLPGSRASAARQEVPWITRGWQ